MKLHKLQQLYRSGKKLELMSQIYLRGAQDTKKNKWKYVTDNQINKSLWEKSAVITKTNGLMNRWSSIAI